MRISDWSSDVCSSDLRSDAFSPLRVGIGGSVGSGKTALMDALCKYLLDDYDIAAITDDIYTREDAEFLTRAGSLPPERILGVETGGCPHTAIREDASINLAAVGQLHRAFPALDLILIESGGNNLRSEEHTSELQSLMSISYADFFLKK